MVRLDHLFRCIGFNSQPLPNMENKKPNNQVSFSQNNPTLSNKYVPKEYPSQKMKSDMRIYINQRSTWGFSTIKMNANLNTFGNVEKLYEIRSAYCQWVKFCVCELKGKYIYADEKYNASTGKLEITLRINLNWEKPSDD